MKRFLLGIFLVGIFLVRNVSAQECAGISMKAGSGFEMDTFDGKNKQTGKMIYKITKVEKEGDGYVLSLGMELLDAKGKSQNTTTYQMHCNGNTLALDAKSMIAEEQMKAFRDMQMKYTYENVEIPAKLSVGQHLKDASVKGEGSSGALPVKFNMLISNRSVTGEEKLTVPAGTFDAFKINADMNMEMQMGFPVKMNLQTISYRAQGVIWDLKTETYRKGKLISSSQLTKIF